VRFSGHVPPSNGHFFAECVGGYVERKLTSTDVVQDYRYTELSLRYQDIILGSLFGVSNAFLESLLPRNGLTVFTC
jgi:endopolyphosphatase